MSLLFEYTNVTNEIHDHVFFIWLAAFDCSCRSSHLLGWSEGREGNDVQSLKYSLFPTFTAEEIKLCVYCYPLIFFGFKTHILKNPRGDWSTKSITRNVTATEGKKGDNFCPSYSIRANVGDCTPITTSVHFSALCKSSLISLVDLTVSTLFNLCVSAEMIHVTLIHVTLIQTNCLAGLFALQRFL